MNELADHRDIALVKLVSRKVTFVHQRLWPQLAAVGLARDAWQMERLSSPGRGLLELVRRRGSVRTDEPAVAACVTPRRPAAVVGDLEARLLLLGAQVHTETGAHAKVLEDWRHWVRRLHVRPRADAHAARAELDQVVLELNRRFDGRGRLPWWR